MDKLNLDVAGNEAMESMLRWYPVHGYEPATQPREEKGWVRVFPGMSELDGRVGTSSSSVADRHSIYGIQISTGMIFEARFTLEGRQNCDQAGVAVYYDDSNWLWAGLEFVEEELLLVTGGRVDGRKELSCHGRWQKDQPLTARLFVLQDSCVVEFIAPSEWSHYHMSSLSAYMQEERSTFDLVRICRLKGRHASVKPHGGLYASDPSGSGASATFHYLGLRNCKGYGHSSQ